MDRSIVGRQVRALFSKAYKVNYMNWCGRARKIGKYGSITSINSGQVFGITMPLSQLFMVLHGTAVFRQEKSLPIGLQKGVMEPWNDL